MAIPTEPIGSIPRPVQLIGAGQDLAAGRITAQAYAELAEAAVRETIAELEATGSPVITDGEQGKPSFATYPLAGLAALVGDGVVIPFADGHTRQLPRLTAGPFRYARHADGYLRLARRYARVPVKQPVIAASALSLIYPPGGIGGYPREAFLADLVREAAADIRGALDMGAHSVQIDFTEGRLAVKLDPSGQLLASFIDLNNQVLAQFSPQERARIGVHTCPGGDQDSTHSADVDYAGLLPSLFSLNAGAFYIQLASEPDRPRVLRAIAEHARPGQRIFVGVIDPIDPRIETAEQVRDRVLEAAAYIEPARLGSCDDCGFAPFGDDTSTSRETAEASSERYGPQIRQILARLGQCSGIIEHPDTGDEAANTARRQILAAYRAYPAGDVFTGMPADVRWYRAALTPADLATVRYIDYPYWTDFAGGTRLAIDGAAGSAPGGTSHPARSTGRSPRTSETGGCPRPPSCSATPAPPTWS